MKKLVTVLYFGLSFFAVIAQSYSPIDIQSKIKFSIKNFGVGTGGDFKGLQGAIVFDPANLAVCSFDMSIDAKTIDTDIDSRDNHLRKEEYFDVANFPRIIIKSTKITPSTKQGTLFLFCDLTIKGVKKAVSFPFTATPKDGGYLFEGNFKINRRDFGVGGNSISLGDNLTVYLSVFATKK